jgi:lysophospholipase L1-like esterase
VITPSTSNNQNKPMKLLNDQSSITRRKVLTGLSITGLSLWFGNKTAKAQPAINLATVAPVITDFSKKKVLIFGDSITDTKGGRTSWVQFAMSTLGVSSYKNFADGGAAFRQRGLKNIDDMPTQLTLADNEKDVDIVIVALGTNEFHRPGPPVGNNTPIVGSLEEAMKKKISALSINDTMYDAIRYAFYTIQEKWNCKCYIVLPIQRAGWNWKQLTTLYSALEEMATMYAFEVIDGRKCGILSEFEKDKAEGRDLRDGLHPKGDEAHKKIAKMVVASLRSTVIDISNGK